MKEEWDNQMEAIFNEIAAYSDGTVSSVFSQLPVQNQLAALWAAPEELYPKFASRLSVDELLTLTRSLYDERLRYADEIVLGVYAQLAALLQDADTEAEEKKKQQMLVSLYNAVPDAERQRILLETLEITNVDAANAIRGAIIDEWTFVNSEDLCIQRLIREIDNSELAAYLQRASEALSRKFLGNMSSRMAEMLKEDMEFMGRVSDSSYLSAQKNICRVYRLLEEAGEVVLPKRM